MYRSQWQITCIFITCPDCLSCMCLKSPISSVTVESWTEQMSVDGHRTQESASLVCYCPCCCDKVLKNQAKGEGVYLLTVQEYSPSWWGKHVVSSLRPLVTLHLQSGSRERHRYLAHFSFSLSPSPSQGIVPSMFRTSTQISPIKKLSQPLAEVCFLVIWR